MLEKIFHKKHLPLFSSLLNRICSCEKVGFDQSNLRVLSKAENTHHRGKYHGTADHLFVLCGFRCFDFEFASDLLV